MATPARGLAAWKQRKEDEERRREERARPKYPKFSLLKDGDSAVVRFAQEVDPNATNYSEKNGIGFVNLEHRNPDRENGWKTQANCTGESQGACYPDELVRDETVDWADRKGWKPKEVFRINVIAGAQVEAKDAKGKTRLKSTDIDQKTGDGEVQLLSQSTYNGIWDALAEYATDDETITDTFWKIKRRGSEQDTSYVLTKMKEIPADAKSVEDFELIDFENVAMREIPYDQQKQHYWNGISTGVSAEEPAREAEPVGASTGTSATW